jgi:hypothetical protein
VVEPANGAASAVAGTGSTFAGSRFEDAGDFEAEFTLEGNDDAVP